MQLSGSVETGLHVRRLERRNRWMWLLNIAIICFLSVTVAILYRMNGESQLPSWLPEPAGEVTLIGGLCGLTMLFCLYMFHKQIELTKMRQSLLDVRIREEAVRSRLMGISSLFDNPSLLLETFEQPVVLDLVAHKTRASMEADHVSIVLLGAGEDELTCSAASGPRAEEWLRKTEQRGHGIVGVVVNTGETMLASGADISAHVIGEDPDEFETVIAAPIAVEEEILGVIRVGRTEPCDLFVPSDARALTTFGTNVAKALKRIEELAAAATPDGRQPDGRRPESRPSGTPGADLEPPRALSVPEKTVSRVGRTLEIVGDESLDLNEVVREGIAAVASEVSRKEIRLEPDLDPNVPGLQLEARATRQAVESLIAAGVSLCDTGNTMWITTSSEDTSVELSIICNGLAVGPELCEQLFQPPDPAGAAGAGQIEDLQLPLHLASRDIERQGGQLWAEAVSGNGLRIRMRLTAAGSSAPAEAKTPTAWAAPAPPAEPDVPTLEIEIPEIDQEERRVG